MHVDKRNKIDNGLGFLEIKTGINIYRTIFFVLFAFSIILNVLYSIFTKDYVAISISLFLSIVFIIISLFIGSFVSIFKLPTNRLLVYKDKIIFERRKKQLVFEVDKIKFSFHSFFEDFESLSQLIIIHENNSYSFLITKKQFETIERFLYDSSIKW